MYFVESYNFVVVHCSQKVLMELKEIRRRMTLVQDQLRYFCLLNEHFSSGGNEPNSLFLTSFDPCM